MNTTRDPDAILSAWLDEGPTDLPDATRRAILTALPTTRQARRGGLHPEKLFGGLGRLAGGAVVTVIAVAVALSLIAPQFDVGPSPSHAGTPSPARTVALETFTSSQYGYSVEHLASWIARPATDQWPEGALVEPDVSFTDTFHPQGTTLGAAVAIAAQWMADWATFRETTGGPCFGPASAWVDATVAGVPARRIEAPCDFAQAGQAAFAEYAWVIDGTGYVITGTPTIVDQMVASFRAGS
jgi:hypothetical protein